MADITSTLRRARVFPKFDLMKGYFQFPLRHEDISTVITPFGTYTFSYPTFSLQNSGVTFKRLLDSVLGDLPFCICYVSIFILSDNQEAHQDHSRSVLSLLQGNASVV
ncbi:uncharacterized protein [Macrobrachium rosenbergii]|uniref:uncharacterized protein n=1 Tax=Macrobrachium rosenbergii TaxID=79674 RepID=UPI0034D74377